MEKEFATGNELFMSSKGALEYAIAGEGKPILGFHGNQGGYDQGLWLYKVFADSGFKLISISRPGYLKTPLATGPTFAEQADIASELIEHLGFDKIGITGASAGGPPAYEFAIRHPDQTGALVVIDGISRTYPKTSKIDSILNAIFLSKTGIHLSHILAKYFPQTVTASILSSCTDFSRKELKEQSARIVNAPEKLECIMNLFDTMDSFNLRKEGTFNDFEQAALIDRLDLRKIKSPSLIIHGTRDTGVNTDDAQFAADTITDSELLWIENASHFGFWLSDKYEEVQAKAVSFFKKHL